MTILLTSRRVASFTALLAGLAFTACGVAPSPDPCGSGSADMTMVVLAAADISSVSVTIMGPALASPRVYALFQSAETWGALVGGLPVGTGYSFTAAANDASGAHLYTGIASNVTIAKDQTAAVVIAAQPTTPPSDYQNAVPVFDSVVVSSIAVGLGEQISAKVTVHDPNSSDTVTYQWTATCGSFSDVLQATTTWTAPLTAGPCTLSIKASDSRGATATASVTVSVGSANAKGLAQVSVVANIWPVITNLSVAPNGWLAVGTPSSLSVTASDADNDPLSYAWSCTCPGDFSSTTVASPTFSLAGGETEVCTFTVTIGDGRGGSTTGDFTLPVGAPTIQAPL